jgi:hypothetical protein
VQRCGSTAAWSTAWLSEFNPGYQATEALFKAIYEGGLEALAKTPG